MFDPWLANQGGCVSRMNFAKVLAKKFLLAPILAKLILGMKLFGIEYVNGYLLTTTQNVKEILNHFGATISESCIIHGPISIHNANSDYSHLIIKDNVHVGREVFFDLTAPIFIEKNAVVSMRTVLLTHQDIGSRPLSRNYPRTVQSLQIGESAYIGASVKLLCGASIGEFSVIGAGSVVIKPVDSYHVVAGVPAKVNKIINPNVLD